MTMSDNCKCFDIEVDIVVDEPVINSELDFDGEVILCSDGEDYQRGYNEGHAEGYTQGQKDGYENGYNKGQSYGYTTGYDKGKTDGISEGYNNGYAQGKADGYTDGYNEGYSVGYNAGYEKGKAEGGDEEFIGVKYSDFETSGYMLPRTADARSLEKVFFMNPSNLHNSAYIFNQLFNNDSTNLNGGFNAALETVYLPSGITGLSSTFYNCGKLKNIIGDLSSVENLSRTFYDCSSLTEIPYMPNLLKISAVTFYNCTGLTSVTFYKVLTSWVNSAFQGCSNITDFNIPQGWNTHIYLHYSPNLKQECLHRAIENLADMTGQTAPKFQVGAENIAKIDDEHITMLENKNYDYS